LSFTKKNNGFSLIELVITLLLLAIVATFIIPKVINLRDDSELAVVQGTAAAFQSAAKSVQQAFIVGGYTTRVQNLPNFGAGNVDTNNNGFPIGINKGSVNENIGRGPNGCRGVWLGILDSSFTVGTGANNDFQSYRHTNNKVCSYVYRKGGDNAPRASAQLVIQYDSRDGQVYTCGAHPELPACPF